MKIKKKKLLFKRSHIFGHIGHLVSYLKSHAVIKGRLKYFLMFLPVALTLLHLNLFISNVMINVCNSKCILQIYSRNTLDRLVSFLNVEGT